MVGELYCVTSVYILVKPIGKDSLWQQLPTMVKKGFGYGRVAKYFGPLHTQSLPPSP